MTMPDDAPGPGSTVWYATGLGWREIGDGEPGGSWVDLDSGGSSRSWDSEHRGRGTGKVIPTPSKKNNDAFTATITPTDIPAYSMATVPLWRAQRAPETQQATTLATTTKGRSESFADAINRIVRDVSVREHIAERTTPESASDAIERAEAAVREKMYAAEAKLQAQERKRETASHVWSAEPMAEAFAADSRLHRLAKRISWLEWALANPPVAGNAYQVMVGPWGEIGVHIPVEVVQQSIRVALADMVRERDALQRGH